MEDWTIHEVTVKLLAKDLLRGGLIAFAFVEAELSKTSSCSSGLVAHIVQDHGPSNIGLPFLRNFKKVSDSLLEVFRQGPLLVQWEFQDETHLVGSVILLSSPTPLVV